jgi:hypothetical protein
LSDISDVRFDASPFEIMQQYHKQHNIQLFLGYDDKTPQARWLKKRFRICNTNPTGYLNSTVYNAGVVGGSHKAITWLLNEMTQHMLTIMSENRTKCVQLSMDMVIINEILHSNQTQLPYNILAGPPFISHYRGRTQFGNVTIRHKNNLITPAQQPRIYIRSLY